MKVELKDKSIKEITFKAHIIKFKDGYADVDEKYLEAIQNFIVPVVKKATKKKEE